jgi:hypothetical protein
MGRKEKNCNKCQVVKNYKLFRKKNNKSGWKDIDDGLRYSYCKQCEADRMRLRYKNDPIPQMLSNSRIRAKKKGILHNLSTDYLRQIWPKNNICPVLGRKFEMGYKLGKTKSFAPSLDRINNKKGYEIGNVVIVSDIVNRIKSDIELKDMIKIAKFYISKDKELK